jgi:hypothetical protein
MPLSRYKSPLIPSNSTGLEAGLFNYSQTPGKRVIDAGKAIGFYLHNKVGVFLLMEDPFKQRIALKRSGIAHVIASKA